MYIKDPLFHNNRRIFSWKNKHFTNALSSFFSLKDFSLSQIALKLSTTLKLFFGGETENFLAIYSIWLNAIVSILWFITSLNLFCKSDTSGVEKREREREKKRRRKEKTARRQKSMKDKSQPMIISCYFIALKVRHDSRKWKIQA